VKALIATESRFNPQGQAAGEKPWSKLGKKVAWRDTVAEFKDYDGTPGNKQMEKFDKLYRRLKE
jgi:hypothetical protein